MDIILAALDMEAGSRAVLARAAQLAKGRAARLVLLHVIEPEPLRQAADASGHAENELRDQLKLHTVKTLETLAIDTECTQRTDIRVEFGAPHDVITRVAEEISADLIVIGPGKASDQGLSEKILGSTADRVIRTSSAAILVVKRATAEPYRRVAVAVDFSPQSASAARQARSLAPDATIELVHVTEFPLAFEGALLRVGTSQSTIDKYHAARTDKSRRDLASFARRTVEDNKAVTRNLEGAPGPALVCLSRDRRIDLLALGPHGRGVVVQALIGSVTQRVLREAACDVLIATYDNSFGADG